MDFRVLGTLEVSTDGDPVPIGGPKQRAVLAHLLVRANHVVSADDLIDEIWGASPPATARKTLQVYVTHLRKALGAERLEWRSPGYVVHIEPDELDAARFESLVVQANRADTSPDTASSLYREALELWRGRPFADLLGNGSLSSEIGRLDELRLQAVEHRVAADLDSNGPAGDLVTELQVLTEEHPLRESLWGSLMLALYRSGRQADALAVYQRARELLADELGVDPSEDLQRLHERILKHDPSLEAPRERLRGYTLLEEIGEGTFGVVYRATQSLLSRDVAIKVVRPELANQPDFVRRFEREAQLVARLEHPHIVPLYDYWREPDAAYLVMRFLRGGSLEDLLRGRPLGPERAAAILDQVGAALAASHQQGVVHRDVKPGNVLLDEDGNAYLSDFGIALETGAPEQTTGTMIRGRTPAYLSPEQIRLEQTSPRSDIYALGVVVYEMLTGEHPFPDTSLNVLLDQHLHHPFPSVRELRPDLQPGVDAAIARATAKDPRARFAEVLEFCTAFRAAVGGKTSSGALRGERRNPYKGLRAFLEADSADFFGRDLLTRRLVERIGEHGTATFLCVVGPSGSGKSSVVRAGVVPAIRRGAIQGSDRWYVVDMLPGPHPLRELETALLRVSVNPPPSLLDELERDELGLARAVDRLLPDRDAELLIVLDQLEELFTMVESDVERLHVLESLRAATADPGSRIRVVATLRADFFDQPLSVRGFGDLLASRNEAITPMSPEELERAIVGPAERVGLDVEPGLVAAMVADVIDRPGALPLLQYALSELADREDIGSLTLNAYRRIGGVAGALARRAERLYDPLDEAGRVGCRQLFLRLVTLGEGMEDTRHRVRRTELLHLDGGEIDPAIDAYGRHRLLSFDRDPATREPTVEIAHEALLRSWPRLRGWIDEARDDIRNHRAIAAEASAWVGAGRNESFLLRGSRLEMVEGWSAGSSLARNAEEREYLDASVRARDAERAAEVARQEREHSLDRRSRKRLRALVAVLTVGALLAGGLALIAQDRSQRAQRESRVATARELAAASVANADVDAQRSLLLAIEAVRATRSFDGSVLPEAEEALHRAIQSSRAVRLLPVESTFIDWSAQGAFVAVTGENDGTVDLRNPENGNVIRTFDGGSGPIFRAVFSPDGSMLAASTEGGRLIVWDVSSGRVVGQVDGRGPATGRSWSADGAFVGAAWHDAGVVKILEIASGAVRIIKHVPVPLATALDPRGERVAIGLGDGCAPGQTGLIVDIDSGASRALQGSGCVVDDFLRWSPDGRYIVTNDDETGMARIWDATTDDPGQVLFGHADEVTAADWSSDSTRLVTGSADGTAIVWGIQRTGARQLISLSARGTGYVWGVAFSPDDQQVMTNGVITGDALSESAGLNDAPTYIRIWDVGDAGDAEVANLPSQTASWWFGDVGLLAGGRQVVVPNGMGPLAIWDVETKEQVGTIGPGLAPEPWGSQPGFEVSVDGGSVAIARGDGTVGVWDPVSGQELYEVAEPSMIKYDAFDLSPNGDHLALVTASRVRIIDRQGRDVGSLAAPSRSELDGARFSQDGRLIALASGDRVTIWDWQKSRRVSTIDGARNPWGRMVFDPGGTLIATAGDNPKVDVWDVTSGKHVTSLARPPGDIYGIAISPDGSGLAIGGTGGAVRMYDVGSGRQAFSLPSPDDRAGVARLVFFPDGSRLAAAYFDGPVRVWTLDIDELLRIAHREVTRTLSDDECRQYLHVPSCPTD